MRLTSKKFNPEDIDKLVADLSTYLYKEFEKPAKRVTKVIIQVNVERNTK